MTDEIPLITLLYFRKIMDTTLTETVGLFEKHVPHEQEALIVLKAHLLLELRLREFVKTRISDPILLKDIFIKNSPVQSGKGLILLARTLANYDEIPQEKDVVNWKAMDILNNLRNNLAHELEPNSDSITQKMKNFIETMRGDEIKSSENLNEIFRLTTLALIGVLTIYRNPTNPSDF